MAESVVARSLTEKEEKLTGSKVRLPEVEKVGEKGGRVGEKTEEKEEVQEVRKLMAPLGPRALVGGLLKRVRKESVFVDADPKLVDSRRPPHAAVEVFQ